MAGPSRQTAGAPCELDMLVLSFLIMDYCRISLDLA